MSRARRGLGEVLSLLRQLGVDPRRLFHALPEIVPTLREYSAFRATVGEEATLVLRPALGDRAVANGSTRGHYFMQDLHVARRIFDTAPRRHIDVGSRVDGFVAHVASFRQLTVVDVRKPSADIPNVDFLVEDASSGSSSTMRSAADSVSCLHALEHFGLGRYGDPIDPQGHLRGLAYLFSLLEADGRLFLSVPVASQPRIEFNAQRVFGMAQLRELVGRGFEPLSWHLIDDSGSFDRLIEGEEPDLWFGCAIVEARRRTDVHANPYTIA